MNASVEHMLRRIGQRLTFIRATLLLAVVVGVIAGQTPLWRELPGCGQLNPLGGCLSNIYQLVVEAFGDQRTSAYKNGVAIGNLLFELVVENGRVGVKAGKIIVVNAEFGIGTLLGFEIRAANG